MSTPPPDVEALTSPTRLLELAAAVPSPTIIGFEPTPEHLAVHLAELPGDDRCGAAGLFGFVAEPTWCALGVSVSGAGRDLDTGDATGQSVAAQVVVDRRSRGASRLVVDGDEQERLEWCTIDPRDTGDAPCGFMLDALHRALGLPSPGAAPAPAVAALAIWAHEIATELLAGNALDWSDAVRLHPGRPARGPVVPSLETIVEATHRAGDEFDWSRVHRRAVAGEGALPPDLGATEAGWMDATMYARWVLGSFCDPMTTTHMLRAHDQHEAADGLDAVTNAVLGDDEVFWIGPTSASG